VVTIVTLMFAPLFAHHHWMWQLVGKTEQSHVEQCVVNQPCPKKQRIVNIVTLPQAPTSQTQGKGSDNNNGDANGIVVDNPNVVTLPGENGDQSEPEAAKHH
jgi:hypothetical protein